MKYRVWFETTDAEGAFCWMIYDDYDDKFQAEDMVESLDCAYIEEIDE